MKSWVFVLIATVVLTANFYGHILSTLPVERFLDNEFPSERFVITRLAMNESEGLDYGGGFMHRSDHADDLYMAVDQEPYHNFRQHVKEDMEQLELYPSHLGFQDDVLYPVWSGLYLLRDTILTRAEDGSRWHTRLTHYDLYYVTLGAQFVVALLNAFVLGLALLWVRQQFSPATAWLTLGLMLVLLPDLTFFGRSMWWMMFTWFLPFLIMAWAYRFRGGAALTFLPLLLVSLIAGGCLSLKTAMGYEFTSTVMVGAVIPATFYALLQRWSLQSWLAQCFVIGVCQVAGLALTLYLHYSALAAIDLDPLHTLQGRFEMRAHGGDVLGDEAGVIGRSVDANVLSVFIKHLFTLQGMGAPQIVIMLPLFAWLWVKRATEKTREDRALLICIALGALGALSMFTILKGHAYIHGFDVVAWSIPMNILLCVFYAQKVTQRFI